MSEHDENIQGAIRRINQLERQLWALKAAGLVLAISFIAYWVLGSRSVASQQPERRVIEADEFVLRDASGKVRARLNCENEDVHLWMYDSKGKARLGAGVFTTPPIFYSDTPEKRKEMMKSSLEKGEQWAGLTWFDLQGKGAASLNAMPWGGELILRDSGKPVFRAPELKEPGESK